VIRRRDGSHGGVVVATDYLTGDWRRDRGRMTQAFEDYNQLRVLKRPLTGVYLSFFLMVTLLILSAPLDGSVHGQADHRPGAAARGRGAEIGAGRLDQRVEPQSNDEFGSLVEAFNSMASELADQPAQGRSRHDSSSSASTSRSKAGGATSKRFSSASRPAWCRSTPRRDHDRSTARGRAARLDRQMSASRRRRVRRADLQPLGALVAAPAGAARSRRRTDIAMARERAGSPSRGRGDRARRRQRRTGTASCWCSTM
jgi:hypothetical protein